MTGHASRLGFAGAIATALLLTFGACTSAPAPDAADVIATVESFYASMKAGDAVAAMDVIAPDAVFLEAGGRETRAEYETNHLPADIEFERAVPGKRGPWSVTFEGSTAWMNALTEYEGTFQDAPVNFVSAQLVVLTRTSDRWEIRTIHWSSRRR